MRLGLLGFGVVGKGVYDLAQLRSDIKVGKVVCLEDITLPDAEVTKDFQSVLNDPTIDTVVEAMGGLHPAFEFVKAAILAGKNIVTSNKALMAHFYDELIPLAEKQGVLVRCTAAVGGGIGWLSELERSRRTQDIYAVGGIVNGTCNFILDAMTRNGQSYDEALKTAQSLGYAEANPSTDIDGIDTYHKLILSANVAFGISLQGDSIPVAGIRNIRAEDVAAFASHGYVCKLTCAGKNKDGVLEAYVQPTLFPASAPEATVPLNYNLITLMGTASDRMSFYGQGAGRYPTAHNVLQDCVDIMRGVGFHCAYGEKKAAENNTKLSYYVRGAEDAFLQANCKERWGSAIVTNPVSVADMHSYLKNNPDAFIAAIPETAI